LLNKIQDSGYHPFLPLFIHIANIIKSNILEKVFWQVKAVQSRCWCPEQKTPYRQELQFFEAQEPQPPELAELMAPPPFPPALLKLQADRSFSTALPPHRGHCSGSLEPNTSSSKLFSHPLQ
jgi:hypothetical protein